MWQSKQDPTKNVLDLVTVTIKRLDDIQVLQFKRVEEKLCTELKRVEDLLEAHVCHAHELNVAEKGRIDAIRQMDVKAIEVLADSNREQAKLLADQLYSKTEGLRKYISSVQEQANSQRELITRELSSRVSALEQNQYRTQGKSEVSKTVIAFIAALGGSVITIVAQHYIFISK